MPILSFSEESQYLALRYYQRFSVVRQRRTQSDNLFSFFVVSIGILMTDFPENLQQLLIVSLGHLTNLQG